LFDRLRTHGRDYAFFAELRAGHSRQEFERMANGGLRDLQIGIEALSTGLLKRLGKGTTVMDNLASMRHCEEHGIRLQANLILYFPGTTEDEVEETLRNLDFVWPFANLRTVPFWLGTESPVSRMPETFGIRGVRAHRYYRHLFPKDVVADLPPFILEYTGDRMNQKRLWNPVKEKVAMLNRKKERFKSQEKFLTYRDGKEFLVIRQVLPDGQGEGREAGHRADGQRQGLGLLGPPNSQDEEHLH
jgi:hypothetical protein